VFKLHQDGEGFLIVVSSSRSLGDAGWAPPRIMTWRKSSRDELDAGDVLVGIVNALDALLLGHLEIWLPLIGTTTWSPSAGPGRWRADAVRGRLPD